VIRTPGRISLSVVLVVGVGVAVLAGGGLIALVHPAGLLPAGAPVTDAARLYADRVAARNLALAVGLVAVLAARAHRMIAALLAVGALVELGDLVGGLVHADIGEAAGAVVVGVAFAWAATRMRPRTSVGSPQPTPSAPSPTGV
jgi:hypothetical protein